MGRKRYAPIEISAARFLLRVFAAQKAWTQRSGGHAGQSLLDEALLQCAEQPDDLSFAANERMRAQAVKLAALQAGALVPREKALELLRREPHNSYTLRDAANACRGWVMYPIASYMNHSCLPNTACTVSAGGRLTFYALSPIAVGEEITQSYLTDQGDGGCTAKAWGFQCTCPRCAQTAGAREVAAFDAVHACACGAIVTAARGGGRACRCHDHHDMRLPPHAPRELCMLRVDVALPCGRSSCITLYDRVRVDDGGLRRVEGAACESAMGAAVDMPPCLGTCRRMAAVVAVSPSDRAEAEADHAFLQSVWCEQRACAGEMASFHLYADSARDEWGAKAGFRPSQLTRLRVLLRARLFDVWAAFLATAAETALSRLSGTFEVFNPAIGANMGWHRDGHGPGEFIAHYYLDCPSPGVPALPMTSDSEERAAISADNFLHFENGVAADQRLVIFEDAAVFHRTPLTAHSASERLQADRQRPIARIVFHGVSESGASLGFPFPSATRSAHRDDPTAAAEAARPQPLAESELPPGLRRALEAHAEQIVDDEAAGMGAAQGSLREGATGTADTSTSSAVGGVTAAAMRASFDAYVAGAPGMIRCMRC